MTTASASNALGAHVNWRYTAWFLSTSIGVLSSLLLFHVYYVKQPFSLLLIHTVLGLAVRILCSSPSKSCKADTTRPTAYKELIVAILFSTILSICTYTALQTCKNPIITILLLSLASHLSAENADTRSTQSCPYLLLQFVAILSVLRYDYRLTIGAAVRLLLMLVAAAVIESFRQRAIFEDSQMLVAAVQLPILGALTALEIMDQGIISPRTPFSLLGLNIFCNASAFALQESSGNILRYSSNESHRLTPLALAGAIGLAYDTLGREIVLPIQQLVAYFIGYALTLRTSMATVQTKLTMDSASADLESVQCLADHTVLPMTSMDIDAPFPEPRKASSIGCLVPILLTCFTWSFLIASSFGMITPDTQEHQHTNGTQVTTSPTLDVVVSYYNEPVIDLAHNLDKIFRNRTGRIFIYNKGRANVSAAIPSALHSRVKVETVVLPNTGRESETFLAHILDRWDDLAPHTFFTQAAMHEPRQALKRLDDYLVPASGFLSLSYVSNMCRDCSDCRDLAAWEVDANSLHAIWRLSHNTTCKNIPLTYRGQFVASAQRIRQGGRGKYELLRFALSEGGFGLSADAMGYTMERMWSVVLQCTEEKIADRCPTLFSGVLGRLGDIEDCQCFDDSSSGM